MTRSHPVTYCGATYTVAALRVLTTYAGGVETSAAPVEWGVYLGTDTTSPHRRLIGRFRAEPRWSGLNYCTVEPMLGHMRDRVLRRACVAHLAATWPRATVAG